MMINSVFICKLIIDHISRSRIIYFSKCFNFYRVNETIYTDLEQEVLANEISIWKALNLCRSIGVILGWFLISMRPNTDLLYKHLKKLSIFGGEKPGNHFTNNISSKA